MGAWSLVEEGDRVVIVLGAGATISEMMSPSPPQTLPPTDANFLQTSEVCEPQAFAKFEEAFNAYWAGGEAYPLRRQRMEQVFADAFLSVAQTSGKSKRGRAARRLSDMLVPLLRDTLHHTTRKAAPREHVELLRQVHDKKPSAVDVISFNYDVLADRALRSGNGKYWNWNHQDGYGFKPDNLGAPRTKSEIRLLKLHGSMNWYIPVPGKTRKTVFNPKAAVYVPKPSSESGSPVWHRRQRRLGHSRRQIFPLMVPPVFEKGTQLGGRFRGLWDQAASALQDAQLVIVWGYSLPLTDYHAELLFARGARRSGSRLIVVNPSLEALARVTSVCGHRWNRWFFDIGHLLAAI